MAKLRRLTDLDSMPWKRIWRENHGTFLLIWAFAIFFAGWGVIFWRQNRFVPPRFPEARHIVNGETGGDGVSGPLDTNRSPTVVIRVTGAASDRGMIQVGVFTSQGSFEQSGPPATRALLEIDGRAASWMIPRDRLPRLFALAVYHDENNDGRLNRDSKGRFSEPTAFSNQAAGRGRPLRFSEAVIPRPMPGEVIDLRLE